MIFYWNLVLSVGYLHLHLQLANKALFEYIEIYYNCIRRHLANGWISPEQYYQNNKMIEVDTV